MAVAYHYHSSGRTILRRLYTRLTKDKKQRYLQTKLELRHQRFHDLRHAMANLLLGQGGALDQVSDILVHSQLSGTHSHYAHMQRDQKRKAMGTLAGLGA
jgi:integrase